MIAETWDLTEIRGPDLSPLFREAPMFRRNHHTR